MTKRTSRWFPYEPSIWIESSELDFLLQDFNLGIVPMRDNRDAYEISVEGMSSNRVKEALSLWNRAHGADSFVSAVSSTLLTEQEVWLEMVFRPDGPNGLPFKPLIVHGVERTRKGNLIQKVPVWDEPNRQWTQETTPQIIELDDLRMIHVSLPEQYSNQLLTKVVEDLVETDLYDPVMSSWAMESMTRQSGSPTVDFEEANRTRTLRITQAALPIGWTAREIYSIGERHFSDYYHYWRELRFLHFRASMRKQAEEALHKVLSMAGAECGFKATVTASGLFTPPEVEEIIREYETSKVTFSAMNDIIFEKPDSTYSRDRRLL